MRHPERERPHCRGALTSRVIGSRGPIITPAHAYMRDGNVLNANAFRIHVPEW